MNDHLAPKLYGRESFRWDASHNPDPKTSLEGEKQPTNQPNHQLNTYMAFTESSI